MTASSSIGGTPPEGSRYLLGHTDHELHRLDIQGDLYRDITRRALVEAGVGPGMRVLDIGCGTGDVSLLAAELVGPTGYVLGIDRGEAALDAARAKVAQAGLSFVDFEVSEIDSFDRPGSFDALVGRFVLMHQKDPVGALRAASGAVRHGGVVVMVESWMEILRTGAHSHPHSPLYDDIVVWKSEVVRRAGADLHAGGRLRSTFLDAGLTRPRARLESPVVGGPDSPYYDYIEQSVKSMLSEAARTGLAPLPGAGNVAERLRAEVIAANGSLVAWPVVAASATA